MELVSFLLFALLIVISPGADFVLVFKNSLAFGRGAGILTGIGIGSGVCLHVALSILGISYLISQNEVLFNVIKYAGAVYLIYLGMTGLFTATLPLVEQKQQRNKRKGRLSTQHFIQGLFCNLLNPKTLLFFLSVFSQLVPVANSEQSIFVYIYGVYIAVLHICWFCLLAYFVTSKSAVQVLQRFGRRVNQLCGVGLISFGSLLLVNN